MRMLKWLLAVVVVLAVVVLAGGLLISPTYSVQRSISINAPAAKIYALVASPKAWQRWSAWNQRDPQMQVTYGGPDSGAGATWSWASKSEGDGRMTFTAAEADKRLAYELYFPDFGSTATGALTLQPEGAATRVTWSVDGDMGSNPVLRWLALAMDSLVGKDFDAGLANLKALAEKP